jgi:hypothetical protein
MSYEFIKGVEKKTRSNHAYTRFYRGATLLSPASWYKLLPACQGVIHWQTGTGLHLLAKEELLVGLVQACARLARSYSSPSRLKPVPVH